MAKKNTTNKEVQGDRTRTFATVVYPESAPDNWTQLLSELHTPVFISPLHDKDINPDGEYKKPHFHIMLMFDGVKNFDTQIKPIFDNIGGVGREMILSTRGYARYLIHLDNPEKYQYNKDEVIALCGADYDTVIGLPTDKYIVLGEMQDFCDRYNVTSFYLLSKYARNNKPDWYRVLCDNGSVFMREFLKSRKWSVDTGNCNIYDEDTGEILI